MVHSYSIESGLLLGQEKVADKSNEITAIPKLLDLLYTKVLDTVHGRREIRRCYVTSDIDWLEGKKKDGEI